MLCHCAIMEHKEPCVITDMNAERAQTKLSGRHKAVRCRFRCGPYSDRKNAIAHQSMSTFSGSGSTPSHRFRWKHQRHGHVGGNGGLEWRSVEREVPRSRLIVLRQVVYRQPWIPGGTTAGAHPSSRKRPGDERGRCTQ
jgi:hypothetical protein